MIQVLYTKGTLVFPTHLHNALPPSMHRRNIHLHMRICTDGPYSTASSRPCTDENIRQTPQTNTFDTHTRYTRYTQDVQHFPGSRAGPTLRGPLSIADTQEYHTVQHSSAAQYGGQATTAYTQSRPHRVPPCLLCRRCAAAVHSQTAATARHASRRRAAGHSGTRQATATRQHGPRHRPIRGTWGRGTRVQPAWNPCGTPTPVTPATPPRQPTHTRAVA